jgi:hypothetical protein
MQLVHNWNPNNNQYVGSSEADESPLETGVYLVPAFATLVAPPSSVTDNHAIVWDGTSWTETLIPEPPVEEPPPPADPIKILRMMRNSRLATSDWVVIRAYSKNEPVPEDWAIYMQALRDLPSISTPLLEANGQSLDMTSVNWPAQPQS